MTCGRNFGCETINPDGIYYHASGEEVRDEDTTQGDLYMKEGSSRTEHRSHTSVDHLSVSANN